MPLLAHDVRFLTDEHAAVVLQHRGDVRIAGRRNNMGSCTALAATSTVNVRHLRAMTAAGLPGHSSYASI